MILQANGVHFVLTACGRDVGADLRDARCSGRRALESEPNVSAAEHVPHPLPGEDAWRSKHNRLWLRSSCIFRLPVLCRRLLPPPLHWLGSLLSAWRLARACLCCGWHGASPLLRACLAFGCRLQCCACAFAGRDRFTGCRFARHDRCARAAPSSPPGLALSSCLRCGRKCLPPPLLRTSHDCTGHACSQCSKQHSG